MSSTDQLKDLLKDIIWDILKEALEESLEPLIKSVNESRKELHESKKTLDKAMRALAEKRGPTLSPTTQHISRSIRQHLIDEIENVTPLKVSSGVSCSDDDNKENSAGVNFKLDNINLAMPAPTAKCSDEETQALSSILSNRSDVKMEKKDVLDPMTLSCDQMEPTGSNMHIPGAAPHNTYTGKGRLIANWQVHGPQRPPRSDRITKD